MPVDFRLKTPNTLGVLLGGGRQVQGSKKGVFAKLQSIFKGKTQSTRPKVLSNGLNKGEVMLQRTDGRNMRIEGLVRGAKPGAPPKTDRAKKLGVKTPKTPETLHEQLDALTNASRDESGQIGETLEDLGELIETYKDTTDQGELGDLADLKKLQGELKSAFLHTQLDELTKAPRDTSGQIGKTLEEVGKSIEKYKDTKDQGELTDLAGLKKLQGELKSAFLHVHVEEHTKTFESVRGKTGHLSQLQDKEIETRGGKSADTLSRLITDRHEAGSQIDKSLAAINKLISQYKGTTDPREQSDYQKLLNLRRDLTTQAVLVEFPNLEAQLKQPLSTKDAETAFMTPAFYKHTNLEPEEFLDLINVAEDLSGGKQGVRFRDGTAADLHSLQTRLEAQIQKLDSMPGPKTAETLEAREECIEALKVLSDEVGIRAGIEGTVDRLVIMQDPSGASPALVAKYGLDKGTPTALATFTEMHKALTPQKLQFKVASVLRDLSTSLPHLHDDGTSLLLRKNREATESLEVLTALVAEGEIPGLLLGRDPEFDKGLIVLQQGWGERKAVEHLKAQHARENKPAPTPEEIKTAREKGKAAATSRYNLTVANRRLALLLKTDRRVWYKPSTWSENGRIFGEGGDSSVRQDKTFIDALKALGGKKAGRDVAFLIANISTLQVETVKAEHELFGLHDDELIRRLPPHEVETIKSGSDYKKRVQDEGEEAGKAMLVKRALERLEPELDDKNPLAHVGISNEDIKAMGLTTGDQAELIDTIATLHSQGLGSVDHVVETNEAVNTVIGRVIRSSLTQENIVSLSQESAEGLGRGLLHDFLIDAVVIDRHDSRDPDKIKKAGELLDHDFGITVKSESVVNTFRRMVARAQQRVTDNDKQPENLTALKTTSAQYLDLERSMVDLTRERKDVDVMLEQAKKVLTDAQEQPPKGLGMDLDPHKPGGLRSAMLVQQALDYQQEIDTLHPRSARCEALVAKRDQVLDQLKGYDQHRGKLPWNEKVANAFKVRQATRPKIEDLKELSDVTHAIIFIREGANLLKEKIDGDIGNAGQQMDAIIQQRRTDQPVGAGFARQLVRVAVLANWPSGGKDFSMRVQDGHVIEGYDPATKRSEIVKMLKDWGLDTDVYAPEIDEVLYGTLTVEDMERWRQEAVFSREGGALMRARESSPMPWNHPIGFMTGRKGMDEETRRAFLSEIQTFKEGEKLNLKAGIRTTGDTNRVSPNGGVLYVRARLAGSSLGQFLIERGSDGFKLHLRTGSEIKGNVDGGAYISLGPDSEAGSVVANASIDVSGGVEGSRSKLTGATFSFPPTEEGTKALIEFVDKMITEEKISTEDWLGAKEVSQSSERTIKAGITGNAGIKGKLMFGKEVGAGISGGLTGAMGGLWKKEQWTSHQEETFKGEVEIRAQAGANVGLYAQLYKFNEPIPAGATDKDKPVVGGNLSPDLVGVGVGIEGAYTRKWKHVLNPDGQYTKGEIVRQSNVRSAKDLGLLSTKALEDKLKDTTFKANFDALMKFMGPEDVLAVTYNTKPEIIELVNVHLDKARQLYNEGRIRQANDLAAKAEALLDDDDNYSVGKVSLIKTTQRKSEVTNLSVGGFLKVEDVTDGKKEHPALVLSA